MIHTVAGHVFEIKHLFDWRRVIPPCYKSYMRSAERLFERMWTMATISASPAVGIGALREIRDLRELRELRGPRDVPAFEAPVVQEAPPTVEGEGLAGIPERARRLALALAAVFAVSLALPAVAAQLTGPAPVAAEAVRVGPVESAAYPAYTVAPGDTLWTIAQRVNPQADPRAVVLQLRVLNDLSGRHVLQAGEVLQLPS